MKTWIVSSLDEETIQGAETIQGRKLFKGGKYMRKYDISNVYDLTLLDSMIEIILLMLRSNSDTQSSDFENWHYVPGRR